MRKICDAIRLLLVFGAMSGIFFDTVSAEPAQTTTGFIYPTGQKEPYLYSGWLAGGLGIEQKYQSGLYHTGQDIEGTPDITRVLAIADGEIIYVSTGGWNYGTGTGNYGLFVKHKLNTGEEFLALYGHIKPDDERLKCSSPCNVNPPIKVYAGVAFATVGTYNTIPHLHFGIHPGAIIPSGRFGNMLVANWSETNGFVDPIDWIKTRQPAGSVPITSWSFNTLGDKEG